MAPSNGHAELLTWLDGQQPAMIALLERVVNIDSGSYDHAGVDAVGEAIRSHLDTRGIATEIIPRPNAGFCLTASVGDAANAERARLYPADGASGHGFFQGRGGQAALSHRGRQGLRSRRRRHEMRPGDELFRRRGVSSFWRPRRHPLRLLFTSDEEIGSPSSKTVIEAMARECVGHVFNSEPGRTGRPCGHRAKGRMVRDRSRCTASPPMPVPPMRSGCERHSLALCRKVEALGGAYRL